MWFVYLIQSKLDSSFYIGFTEHLRKRITEHNQGKTKSIKHKAPSRLIYFEAYPNKTLARKREIELKKNSFRKKNYWKDWVFQPGAPACRQAGH